MTGEELERAIEFLLKNQANFDARMDRLEAAQAETSQQIRDLTVAQQGTQQQVSATQQQVSATQLQLNHLSEVVATIAETTQRNSEDIDALVKLVGGLVEGRNGKHGS
jgi:chromosome segregation ATPase